MKSQAGFLVAMMLVAAASRVAAEDLPLPAGSVKNASLGGATTLAPGKNYTRSVYETKESIDAVTEFYQRSLADAAPVRADDTVTFSAARGTIKLTRLATGTRITLIVGPQ